MEIFFWQIHPLFSLKHTKTGYIGRKKSGLHVSFVWSDFSTIITRKKQPPMYKKTEIIRKTALILLCAAIIFDFQGFLSSTHLDNVTGDILIITTCINIIKGLLTPIALILLSAIASNKATRNITRATSVIYIILLIIGEFGRLTTSHISAQLILSAVYFIRTIATLYAFGVITRNNQLNGKIQKAFNIYFVLNYLISFIIHNVTWFFLNTAIYWSICAIIAICNVALIYQIINSNIFDGNMACDTSSKNPYKFWNKYFKWWLISIIVFVLLSAILG